VVILNLPDPNTAQLNRFFTFEFFSMIRSILHDEGVFSFRVSSAENYISRELSLYLSSIYQTLKSSFKEVKILPGSNNVFLASKKKDILFDDWQTIVTELKQREISTRFVNENFLPDRLSPLRVAFLKNAFPHKAGRINYDLKPICYFYNSILSCIYSIPCSTPSGSFIKPKVPPISSLFIFFDTKCYIFFSIMKISNVLVIIT